MRSPTKLSESGVTAARVCREMLGSNYTSDNPPSGVPDAGLVQSFIKTRITLRWITSVAIRLGKVPAAPARSPTPELLHSLVTASLDGASAVNNCSKTITAHPRACHHLRLLIAPSATPRAKKPAVTTCRIDIVPRLRPADQTSSSRPNPINTQLHYLGRFLRLERGSPCLQSTNAAEITTTTMSHRQATQRPNA